MMKTIRQIDSIPRDLPLALSIGNYDGVHLGHLHVLDTLKLIAKENQSKTLVISFENHPREVLDPTTKIPRLTTVKKKRELLENAGIDYLLLLSFTKEFASQTAESFLRTLTDALQIKALVLGFDASFGKDRGGDPQTVTSLGEELHFQTRYVEALHIDDGPVSSSRIRTLIAEGKMEAVRTLLGRPYSLEGTVIRGKSLGKELGFPTANLELHNLCPPPFGVYAVQTNFGPGMANFGIAPTLKDQSPPLLEVHLFNHTEPLYEELLEVELLAYLRPEIKFSSKDSLVEQLHQDQKKCLKLLKSLVP